MFITTFCLPVAMSFFFLFWQNSCLQGWWRAHHFITTIIGGVLLVWPDGDCYQTFRWVLLVTQWPYIAHIQSDHKTFVGKNVHDKRNTHMMSTTRFQLKVSWFQNVFWCHRFDQNTNEIFLRISALASKEDESKKVKIIK